MRIRSGLFSLLPALLLSGCSAGGGEAPGDSPRTNVVIVSIDTLRADSLGAYGGPMATPAFDFLAANGVLFEQVIAPAPETGPSHATLFTGQVVRRHAVVRNGIPLSEEVLTLAEAFRSSGYSTAGFVSAFVLDPRFGFRQGFDHFDAHFTHEEETLTQRTSFWAQHDFEGFDRRALATNSRVLPWLRTAEEPFFLFVHYYDPHIPYIVSSTLIKTVPDEFGDREARERIDLLRQRMPEAQHSGLQDALRRYQAEVLYVDRALGAVMRALRDRGVVDRTLFVVTADHGEGLGQHGSMDHAPHLYEEQLRVPLILRGPSLPQGRRIGAIVGLVDLAPTLAALAEVEFPADVDGRSLVPLLRGKELEDRPVVGRRRRYPKTFRNHRGIKYFVRTPRWKYIRATEDPDELYDLTSDSAEKNNVYPDNPSVVARLSKVLDGYLGAYPAPDEAPPLSEESRRGLESLGYVE